MNRSGEHRLRVRYGETDQMGVVHHANFLIYMEEGRTRLMADLGCPYSEMEARGHALVVRRADLRFRASARYDDELTVGTRLERVRRASVSFAYSIRRSSTGELLVEGSTELACVDLRAGDRKPAPLPPEIRRLWVDSSAPLE